MAQNRCISCMNVIDSPVCPYCGYPVHSQTQPHQLPVGTMLRGRYQVGRVLGQGGFGITYMAWDTLMENVVAVKEFYPGSTVNRNTAYSPTVQCNTTNMGAHYEASKERFLREAKALVRFRSVPEVVDILDFMEENNTAYIVMEFVRGVDLAKYIQSRGGRLSVEETFRILKPVMEALATVHKGGIVHRDISPDNIILDPMGGAKLLDFGAVRTVEDPGVDKALNKSTEAILKHGFAPIEQYNTRGSLGPWTDEYAMCATVFYCLTGRIPEEASIRVSEGIDPDWDSIEGLPEHQKRALEKGMSVRAKDRYPDMDTLMEGLFPEAEATLGQDSAPTSESVSNRELQPKRKFPYFTVASLCFSVVALLGNIKGHINRIITANIMAAGNNYNNCREVVKKINAFLRSVVGARTDSLGMTWTADGTRLNPSWVQSNIKHMCMLILPTTIMLCVSIILCFMLLMQLLERNKVRKIIRVNARGGKYAVIVLMVVYIAALVVFHLIEPTYLAWIAM